LFFFSHHVSTVLHVSWCCETDFTSLVHGMCHFWCFYFCQMLFLSTFKVSPTFKCKLTINLCITFEQRHDKTNIMGLPPAWIQTNLRISTVWSGSMLLAVSFSTCKRVGKRTKWILIRLRTLLVLHGAAYFIFIATKSNLNS
jgi:hypothetical protein